MSTDILLLKWLIGELWEMTNSVALYPYHSLILY